MDDEVDELVADDLLKTLLREDTSRHSNRHFEKRARATLLRVVKEARRPSRMDRINFHEAVILLQRLLAATANHPGVLAKALGYRDNQKDAEQRAMMRAMEFLHNDPLPPGSTGGRPPPGRGHRVKASGHACMLCGARGSVEKGWRSDCPKNPPPRIRSKGTCAVAVAEAAHKAGITNTQGKTIDSGAVLKMYNRWQKDGSPREREQERLLRKTQS